MDIYGSFFNYCFIWPYIFENTASAVYFSGDFGKQVNDVKFCFGEFNDDAVFVDNVSFTIYDEHNLEFVADIELVNGRIGNF